MYKLLFLLISLFPSFLKASDTQIFKSNFGCCENKFEISIDEEQFEQTLSFSSGSKTRSGKTLSLKKNSSAGEMVLWNTFLQEDAYSPPRGNTIVDLSFDGDATLYLALASTYRNTFAIIPISTSAEADPIPDQVDATSIKLASSGSPSSSILPLTNEIIPKLKSISKIRISSSSEIISIETQDKYGEVQNLEYDLATKEWTLIDPSL
jgi:hypothetical protein